MRDHPGLRARGAFVRSGALVVGAAACLGCNLRHELVSPEITGAIIDEEAASGPTGANGLRIGALGALRLQTGGGSAETFWQLGGLLADEWKSSSPNVATNEIDRRSVSTSNASVTAAYNSIQQSRGYFRDAIVAMETYRPYDPAWRGELYLGLGFLELQMAETLCNGVPIGYTVSGVPQYGSPLTNEGLFNLAIAHFDSGLTLTAGTDTASVRVRPAVLVAKARALVNLGKVADAAALLATVSTSYQYVLTFSTGSGLNGNWLVNSSLTQYTVSDSTDATGQVRNALPFVSARDPRVPSANPNRRGTDGATPLFTQSIWANTGQIPLLSGVDARLIEAEAKLKANDIPGMTTALNALRTTAQTLGTFRPATQTALSQPSSQSAAVALYFREKAFWTFGRGQRLGDLRRLVRQYALPAATVFPTGTFFKGGTYGDDLNLPVPDGERANPLFNGCVDRNA